MDRKGVLPSIAILALFFVGAGGSLVNPALQGLAEFYKSVPFTTLLLVATLPTLVYVPASIIGGSVAGSKIKYRTLALAGLLLWIVGGLAPYFVRDFAAVLIARTAFGIGLGLISPLGGALVLRMFEGAKRGSMMGYGSALTNGGAIVFMTTAGYLAAKSVHLVWWAHLLGVLALIIVALWLPEPEKVEKVAGAPKVPTPFGVWGYAILLFVTTVLMYPMLLSMSTLITTSGLGTAAAAGTVLSTFTIGGFVGSLAFGKVSAVMKRLTIALALFLFGVGMVTIAYGTTLPMLYVGAAIVGLGSGTCFPSVMMLMGKIAPPAVIGGAVGVIMAGTKLAGFVSPYYMQAIAAISGNASVTLPLVVGAVGFVALGIVFLIGGLKPEVKEEVPTVC